MSIRTFK